MPKSVVPTGNFVLGSVVFTTRPGTGAQELLLGSAFISDRETSAFTALRALLGLESSHLVVIRSDDHRLEAPWLESPVELPGLFILRFATSQQCDSALEALRQDDRVLTANRPLRLTMATTKLRPIAEARLLDAGEGKRVATPPWESSGFRRISLRQQQRHDPVTVIDDGYPNRSAFGARLRYHGDHSDEAKLYGHGMQVAGVLAGEEFSCVPRGCCSAAIEFTNAHVPFAGSTEYSEETFHRALSGFLTSHSRVLNISFTTVLRDDTIKAELETAQRCGKLIVAAMPSSTDAGSFPCDQPSVLAVGNSDGYEPHASCAAWISVPASRLAVLARISHHG